MGDFMKLEMTGQMRLEQKMKLAPHMIQSMEILQLPILALQERIEQELNSNPVLEVEEPAANDDTEPVQQDSAEALDDKDSVISSDQKNLDNFERLDSLDKEYTDYMDQAGVFRRTIRSDEPDRKLEALKNTEALPKSLHEYLLEQWGLVEADQPVKNAGVMIIDYIDDRGYLSVRLEQLHNKDKTDFTFDDLKAALQLVQKLDPPGVGARDLKECLLIQIAQNAEDMSFESHLISEHMDELLENRLPDIAKKMNCSLDRIKHSIELMSKFDTSPGLQIEQAQNHIITADIIVEPSDDPSGYSVWLANSNLPNLRINSDYAKMAIDNTVIAKTRKFLQDNIRSGQWIMDAIEQRKNTLLKVAKEIVKHQKDFFDKGQLYLKPLPMSKVADNIGVHIATVSRAVAGKYLQYGWNVLPLRKFFSGGTEDDNGTSYSWEAIRAKLQQIINKEDKTKPLSDDSIRKKLAEEGISNLARRTIAKYRKLLNIPSARLRKKY